MKKLTEKELRLWAKAHEILGTPVKTTNKTCLSYILEKRIKELQRLIEEVKEAKNEEKAYNN